MDEAAFKNQTAGSATADTPAPALGSLPGPSVRFRRQVDCMGNID
jgi:hypothetical protein